MIRYTGNVIQSLLWLRFHSTFFMDFAIFSTFDNRGVIPTEYIAEFIGEDNLVFFLFCITDIYNVKFLLERKIQKTLVCSILAVLSFKQ